MSNPQLSLQQKNTTNMNPNKNMNTNTNIKTEQSAQPAIDWESEQQLVSSLAKLQELESKARLPFYFNKNTNLTDVE